MTVQIMGGFVDAPQQSARAFRAVLTAMSRPGLWQQVDGAAPPAPLSPAAGALILTLVDHNTPLHLAGRLDCDAVRGWITFHTGAPLVRAQDAAFAVGAWDDLQPLDRFAVGTPEYPDRAATLIVEMAEIPTDNARLTGPGIDGVVQAHVPGDRRTAFPLGLDLILTAGTRLMGLPRSTKTEFF